MGYEADLKAKIQEMKRAAIDAYMTFEGGMFVVEGDKYRQVGDGGLFEPTCYVSRPGEDGAGGGDWWSSPPMPDFLGLTGKYQSNFNEIRSHIDALFDPWLDLPDPAKFEAELAKVRKVLSELGVEGGVDGGMVIGSGPLAAALQSIIPNLDEMSGKTIGAFKLNFLGRLVGTAGNIRALGLILGASLVAERKVLEELRAKVLEFADKTVGAFAAVANTGNAGEAAFSIVLALGSALAGAAAAVITGGAALPAVLTGVGFTFVSSLSDVEISGGGARYTDIMNALAEGLNNISEDLLRVEKEIADNLNRNYEAASGAKNYFDLSLSNAVDKDGKPKNDGAPTIERPEQGEVIYKPELVEEITGIYMPEAARALDVAGDGCTASMTVVAYRRENVGLAYYGPGDSFYKLNNLMRELLFDLAWDVRTGAERLSVVVADILNHDQGLKERYESVSRAIEQGSGIDPWDGKSDR